METATSAIAGGAYVKDIGAGGRSLGFTERRDFMDTRARGCMVGCAGRGRSGRTEGVGEDWAGVA